MNYRDRLIEKVAEQIQKEAFVGKALHTLSKKTYSWGKGIGRKLTSGGQALMKPKSATGLNIRARLGSKMIQAGQGVKMTGLSASKELKGGAYRAERYGRDLYRKAGMFMS